MAKKKKVEVERVLGEGELVGNAKRGAPSTAVKTAATVTIHDPDKMTLAGRKRIAKWLRSRASWLEKHGDLAAGRFRQRYLYVS